MFGLVWKTVRANVRAIAGYGGRFAAIALCITIAGCPMTLQNDVRLGRLTASAMHPEKAMIVYGLDASHGQMIVALDRYDRPWDGKRCGQALAQTPEGATGMTYYAFDAPPGNYVVRARMTGDEQLRYVVPAGKQVYIGDFVVTPEGQFLSQYDSKRTISLSRNIEAAKAALGPKAERLELAETGPPGEAYAGGFLCMP